MTKLQEIKYGAPNNGPLKGIRVLDLSRLLAGGFCTHNLADMGAEVIKIEGASADLIDPIRIFTVGGIAAYWKILSRNKKSFAIDYTSSEVGRKVFTDLVKSADVLVENFKFGGLEKFNLGPDILHKINPKLIIARITGWGQTGPYKHKPGFGTLVESLSGYVAKSGTPESGPLLANFGLGDQITGITGAFAILAALREVEVNNGKGQIIDLSLLDGMASFLGTDPLTCKINNRPIPRLGNDGEIASPRGLYLTKDNKYLALSAAMPSMVKKLFKTIGRDDMNMNPKFNSNENRIKHNVEINQVLADFIGKLTKEEGLKLFDEAGVTVGPCNDAIEVLKDEHVCKRGVYVNVEDQDLGLIPMNNVPARLSETPGAIRTPAPSHGEHTEAILRELGLSDKDIFLLNSDKVIKCRV